MEMFRKQNQMHKHCVRGELCFLRLPQRLILWLSLSYSFRDRTLETGLQEVAGPLTGRRLLEFEKSQGLSKRQASERKTEREEEESWSKGELDKKAAVSYQFR